MQTTYTYISIQLIKLNENYDLLQDVIERRATNSERTL